MAISMETLTGENALHISIAARLDQAGVVWCHVPNGEKRDKRTAGKLKKMGVKPGVPDILIFTEPRCAIELKDGRRGRLSDAQKVWRKNLEENGWLWYECRTVSEVETVFEKVYRCRLPSKKKTLNLTPRVKPF